MLTLYCTVLKSSLVCSNDFSLWMKTISDVAASFIIASNPVDIYKEPERRVSVEVEIMVSEEQ